MNDFRGAARATRWVVMCAAASWMLVTARPTRAQNCDFTGPAAVFPRIPLCAFAGAYQDSSLLRPDRCLGRWAGPLADSVRETPRTITMRFRRDRRIEARADFGGYRIYRVVGTPDTSQMMLLRRFSKQRGDERTWNYSTVSTDTTFLFSGNTVAFNFRCGGGIVHDSVVTFIDPDSAGNFRKVCRLRRPQTGIDGACLSIGDSVFVIDPPPGPHDGFRTWYSITYELKNASLDGTYEDMFIPDTTGIIGPCGSLTDRRTCPNLNNKAMNLVGPIEPTAGPTSNLEQVYVVPNPFRAREAWDRAGANEIHFINLPRKATIKIYTVAGDLVAKLEHEDSVRDFRRWDLKNQNGRDISSGIYLFRIEADAFDFQNRFVVIR